MNILSPRMGAVVGGLAALVACSFESPSFSLNFDGVGEIQAIRRSDYCNGQKLYEVLIDNDLRQSPEKQKGERHIAVCYTFSSNDWSVGLKQGERYFFSGNQRMVPPLGHNSTPRPVVVEALDPKLKPLPIYDATMVIHTQPYASP